MRQGYAPLLEALRWMGKNKKVDCSRSLGGAMGVGIHTAKVVEYVNGGTFCDYILQTADGLMHKERVWSRGGKFFWSPPLGSWWKFELHYGGDGIYHIEKGGELYYLLDETTNRVVKEAERIGEIYAFIKEKSLKLKYLRMKWKNPVNQQSSKT